MTIISTEISLPKLKDRVDWHLWLDAVITSATEARVWEYINPNSEKKLKAPKDPDPLNYKKVSNFRVDIVGDDGNVFEEKRKGYTQR